MSNLTFSISNKNKRINKDKLMVDVFEIFLNYLKKNSLTTSFKFETENRSCLRRRICSQCFLVVWRLLVNIYNYLTWLMVLIKKHCSIKTHRSSHRGCSLEKICRTHRNTLAPRLLFLVKLQASSWLVICEHLSNLLQTLNSQMNWKLVWLTYVGSVVSNNVFHIIFERIFLLTSA